MLLYVHGSEMTYGGGGGGGGGGEVSGSSARSDPQKSEEAVDHRPKQQVSNRTLVRTCILFRNDLRRFCTPTTAFLGPLRQWGPRQCKANSVLPLIAVSTAVRSSVTESVSVALLLVSRFGLAVRR